MTGHHVTQRFGWDCHGLPVEREIGERLEIKTKQVIEMGIDKCNEACRAIATLYVGGRGKDSGENREVMPYNTDLKTPLSNFEANSYYKEVSDPGIMVSFSIVNDPEGASFWCMDNSSLDPSKFVINSTRR
ncbi:hypothetical protein K7X08_004135 [Anisodus acutangulus]|uniref:Aminoacyl-tRNA synthetase class Ia domain-containing protein n=1 Tax=Anisodus acutangulus TaxID=402998 RepID=A0A9Q1MGP7_9SOLA|nr:hypothetical protein K7X08_004135 [Anisodus acutangulus]